MARQFRYMVAKSDIGHTVEEGVSYADTLNQLILLSRSCNNIRPSLWAGCLFLKIHDGRGMKRDLAQYHSGPCPTRGTYVVEEIPSNRTSHEGAHAAIKACLGTSSTYIRGPPLPPPPKFTYPQYFASRSYLSNTSLRATTSR